MKSTAATIDASVKVPIKPEKEVICAMETFSTVYRAKIECYRQVKCRHDFRIDCGTFDLAGHRWAISYYPAYIDGGNHEAAALHIRLLTDTNTSLILDGKISLIDPTGKPSITVGYTSKQYNKRDDAHIMSVMKKEELDSSEYVKDGCLTFECLVRATKWSPVEVVKETPQSAITTSNFWEDLSRHMEGGKGADVSLKVCDDIKKSI